MFAIQNKFVVTGQTQCRKNCQSLTFVFSCSVASLGHLEDNSSCSHNSELCSYATFLDSKTFDKDSGGRMSLSSKLRLLYLSQMLKVGLTNETDTRTEGDDRAWQAILASRVICHFMVVFLFRPILHSNYSTILHTSCTIHLHLPRRRRETHTFTDNSATKLVGGYVPLSLGSR
jgi:hypothetical protein